MAFVLNPIKVARRRMKTAFEKDPDFRHAYEANIAMLLYDKYGGIFEDYNVRMDAAKAILDMLFWDRR